MACILLLSILILAPLTAGFYQLTSRFFVTYRHLPDRFTGCALWNTANCYNTVS
jgi:hypothetical protein